MKAGVPLHPCPSVFICGSDFSSRLRSFAFSRSQFRPSPIETDAMSTKLTTVCLLEAQIKGDPELMRDHQFSTSLEGVRRAADRRIWWRRRELNPGPKRSVKQPLRA
jgi:hypothetical protein